MKRTNMKRWNLALFILFVLLLACLTGMCAVMTKDAYGDWMRNRYSVQERLYESIGLFFGYTQMLIFSAVLLALAVCRLVRIFRPRKAPGRASRFFKKRGLFIALACAAGFILFFLLDRAAIARIKNTVETSEVPAALHDYRMSGWLEIGAELSALGTVVSLGLWIRSRCRKTPRAEKSA